ncbi:AAA family ATPase [Mycobacterium sp.]|uniref:AAA family ATPase n=1 Tax=Mycobacterium sp. TaxID=1785 RepID=UPI0031D4F6BD
MPAVRQTHHRRRTGRALRTGTGDRHRRPEGSGKTTTAEQRVVGLLRLDAKPNSEAVHADPGLLLTRPRPLLIDEWQQVPEVWDVVRRAVDASPPGGQFLLTGSASARHGATAHSVRGVLGGYGCVP